MIKETGCQSEQLVIKQSFGKVVATRDCYPIPVLIPPFDVHVQNMYYTALSQKLSESQHKNRVCHRWSKCNGKCLHGFWARNIPLQPLQRYKKSDYLRCLVSDAKRVFRSTGLIYLDNLFVLWHPYSALSGTTLSPLGKAMSQLMS